MDIFHINLASQVEKSYSTLARWALRAIRKYFHLGLNPRGHIVYHTHGRYTIPPRGCGDMNMYPVMLRRSLCSMYVFTVSKFHELNRINK